MDIRNCKHCNRLFQYQSSKYCPNCVIEMDQVFIKVREYIYDYPNSTVVEVSENTGVDTEIIMEFLREGKLELKEATMLLECKSCGKAIKTGVMCKECLSRFETEMKKGLGKAKDNVNKLKDSDKMYSAEFFKKRKET